MFIILTISTTVSSLYTSMGELYWMFSKKGFPTVAEYNKHGTWYMVCKDIGNVGNSQSPVVKELGILPGRPWLCIAAM